MLKIITVFCARLYGSLSRKNKQVLGALREAASAVSGRQSAARYQTRRLNRGKWREALARANAYADAKDAFVRALGRTGACHHLDGPKAFRGEAKKCHRPDIPVHLQDQARFAAVDAMRRFIEAGIATVHLRAEIFARCWGEKRHYALWRLRTYERVGAVWRGVAPVAKCDRAGLERKEAVRLRSGSLRKALCTASGVRLRQSTTVDRTLHRVFEPKGRQYVAVASLGPVKRLVLPLRG